MKLHLPVFLHTGQSFINTSTFTQVECLFLDHPSESHPVGKAFLNSDASEALVIGMAVPMFTIHIYSGLHWLLMHSLRVSLVPYKQCADKIA